MADEPEDLIRYDVLAQEALRGVVRKVMQETAKAGLPGEHHFYISFATHHPGVRLSTRMREQYPDEMTIVVQHQYWDLKANDHGFEIGLSFNDIPENLLIPYAAIRGFFDPSVQFGLQFEAQDEEADGDSETGSEIVPLKRGGAQLVAVDGETKPDDPEPRTAKTATEDDGEDGSTDEPDGTADVVSLDAFRKKP